MRYPFNGDFPITQYFNDPCCREAYAKFLVLNHEGQRVPLPGHNGIDFGCPQDTTVVAPHSGKIIEVNFDALGYGWYIKIENDKEGSVLAHLHEGSIVVKVGDLVDEGQKLALSNNSGYSTAPHLHWGYYRMPRDRANGWGGFEDPMPYLIINPGSTPTPAPTTPQIVVTDPDQLNGLEVLVAYREIRKAGKEGNFEGYVRAIVGNDDSYTKLLEDDGRKDELIQQLQIKLQQATNLPSENPVPPLHDTPPAGTGQQHSPIVYFILALLQRLAGKSNRDK